MRKYLIVGDIHRVAGVSEDSAFTLVRKIIKEEKFDAIYDLGDHLDFDYISKFSEGVTGLVEGKRIKADLELLKSDLKFYRENAKEILFLEGNHEERLDKYLEKRPELKGLFSIGSLCKEVDVRYIPIEKQPHKIVSDLYVTHGLSYAENCAKLIVMKWGCSIIQGHAHRTQSFSWRYPVGGKLTGFNIGTLGPLNPKYSAGKRIQGDTQSFGILYVDDNKKWQFDTISIVKKECIIAGKKYSL